MRVRVRKQEEEAPRAVAAARAVRLPRAPSGVAAAQALELEARRTGSRDELVPPVEQASRGGSAARQVVPSPDATVRRWETQHVARAAGVAGVRARAAELEWARTQLGGAPRRQRPRRRDSPRRRCCRHCSAHAGLPVGPLPDPHDTPFRTTDR